MPTYEYACTACGSEWEEVQRITASPVEVCPTCGKSSAHRLISAGTGFILKGGGWYSDLYSSPKPPSNKADSKEGASATETTGTAAPAATDGGSKKDAPAKTETKAAAPSPAAPTTPTSSTPASSA
jgi:putative FmdB family regulatory protein